MNKWHHIFHRNTGLSPYVWVVFCILPFYFIFRTSSTSHIVSGIAMVVLFFICYRLSFVSQGWKMYFWTSVQIAISIAMSIVYDYVYFAIFLAFFIGNITNRTGFFTMYAIHLISTFVVINYGLASSKAVFFSQFPFIFISLIVVILLPFNTYKKNMQGRLEGELENANKKLSELTVLEERQRIARDLHDTLGQKLSLIGLKSDLAGRLVETDPARARAEMSDVQQTARTALKEVRELVTQMRGTRLEDELARVRQILLAAEIELELTGDLSSANMSLLTESVVGMCLKEAVTNVVKHSGATVCRIAFTPGHAGLTVTVRDNGAGIGGPRDGAFAGNGLRGMKERLEFVNGTLEIVRNGGTTLIMKVPGTTGQPWNEQAQEGGVSG